MMSLNDLLCKVSFWAITPEKKPELFEQRIKSFGAKLFHNDFC